MTLQGKVAIVTGASRNIGKAIAITLAKEGANIGFVYRANKEQAEDTASQIRGLHRKVIYDAVDVMDWEQSHAFVDRVARELGRIDILVSNAGVPSAVWAPIVDTDPDEMARQFRTHVMGAFHFSKAAVPHMRKLGRGHIILLSSVTTRMLTTNRAPYNTAKAALEAFGKVLAKEEQPYGIRVNMIGPGVTETERTRGWLPAARGVATIEEARALQPFGRIGQTYDIANLALFFCSEAAEYITGQVVYVDGGEQEHGSPVGVRPGK
ncbi:MAG: SDR family oxidoreductase [Chloroflexi bacterium]|nr:SDR family oxidoreductase [Chloroflexota bacterium]